MSPISRKDGNKFDDPVSDGNHIRVILAEKGQSAKKQRGNDVGTGNASLRFQAKLLCR